LQKSAYFDPMLKQLIDEVNLKILILLGLLPCLTYAFSTSDVILRKVTNLKSSYKFHLLDDCKSKIREAVCLVNPTVNGEDPQKRTCLNESDKYQSFFEGHYDRSPPMIKKMYCYLDKIFVEKEFVGTAYASPLIDSNGKIVSGAIGIRKEVLDSPLTFTQWLSWKEETSFGGSLNTTDQKLGLIKYYSNIDTKDLFLDYVLNHEFGHLFDFANSFNASKECNYDEHPEECTPLPLSWGEFSWLNEDEPKPESDYAFREQVCFYFCRGKFIDKNNVQSLFEGLINTNFQSIYSSTYPHEDFAETFALFLAHDYSKLNYGVIINGKNFNLTDHFTSDLLKMKRNYVTNFILGNYKYPGE
jgi:hypothetical protein